MDNAGRIRTHLKNRDENVVVRNLFLLLVGIVTSMAAPAVILGFMTLLLHQWGWELNWVVCFLGGMAVTLPILFKLEWQAQGPMLDATAMEGFDLTKGRTAPKDYKHLGTFGQVVTAQRTPFNGLIEFFLIGPNLAVRSLRKLMLRKLAESGKFARVVEVAEILSKLKGGVEIPKLLGDDETVQQLSCALAYLIFFDWAGVATDGTKVWLTTESRRELAK